MNANAVKRAAFGFLATVALAASAMFVTAPANAAPSDCAAGDACVWKDSTYVTNGSNTAFVRFASGIPDIGTWQYKGTSIWAKGANSPKSAYNHGTQQKIRIYTSLDYKGTYVQIARNDGDGNISNSVGVVTASNFPGKLRSARFVA